MTTKGGALIVVARVLLTALLPACDGKEASISVPLGAQAGDLVGLEPCTHEANKVEYAADCGTLVVTENRAGSNSRLIALPVIRVRATGDSPAEPIFYSTGGPGGSNLHFQHLEDMIEKHDFVQVGYRAVDGSVILDCPEISEAIRGAPALLSDEALESYSMAAARCARRLRGEGVDLAGYTIAETVVSNEDALVASGHESVSLVGGN